MGEGEKPSGLLPGQSEPTGFFPAIVGSLPGDGDPFIRTSDIAAPVAQDETVSTHEVSEDPAAATVLRLLYERDEDQ